MEERYNIKVTVKNKMIPIKGRIVRSPVEFSVPKSRLSYYKSLIKSLGITECDYIIEDFVYKEIKPRKTYKKNITVKTDKSNFRKNKEKTLDKFF